MIISSFCFVFKWKSFNSSLTIMIIKCYYSGEDRNIIFKSLFQKTKTNNFHPILKHLWILFGYFVNKDNKFFIYSCFMPKSKEVITQLIDQIWLKKFHENFFESDFSN